MAKKATEILEGLRSLGVLNAPVREEQEEAAEPLVEEVPDRSGVLLEAVDATIGRLDSIAGELAELRMGLVAIRKDLGLGGLPAVAPAQPPRSNGRVAARAPAARRAPTVPPGHASDQLLPAYLENFKNTAPSTASEARVMDELLAPGPALPAPSAEPAIAGDYLGLGALQAGGEVRRVREEG